MALKALSWKAPSVETISTSLTYIALTGALLAPLATAKPILPAAIEARSAPPSSAEAILVSPKATQSPEIAPQNLSADEPVTEPAIASLAETGTRELRSLPPGTQLAEARSRLKSVKAKEAPASKSKDDAPVSEDAKTPEPPANASTAKTEAEPEQADVRITETKESKKASKASAADETANSEKRLPPPTATVPVASSVPVDPVGPAPMTVWTDADITAALKECVRLLAPVNAEIEVNPAMRKGQCGTPAPILLKSLGTNPKVTFQPAVEVNCQMAVALGEWAVDTLQPAARDSFSSEVKSIVGASGYSCRNRYGLANERLSEHALANAIDIGGFALANGKSVKVSAGWGTTARDRVAAAKASAKPADIPAAKDDTKDDKLSKTPTIKGEKTTQRAALKTAELNEAKDKPLKTATITDAKVVEVDGTSTPDGKFLRRLHEGACGAFGTVLGPEANEAHRDHLHFDLKARKRRAVCQ